MTTQQYVAPQTQGTAKQSDPFWFRQNTPHLYGVTNARNNRQFGIEDISLKPASANQAQYGILFNGLLRTIIGSISFQLRVSARTQAPFVQTISTESGVDPQGKKTYWDHILLTPQVKAQILRHAEAVMTGQVQQPVQQPMQTQYQAPQQFNQAPMYQQPAQQQPMYQQPMTQQPMYQQQAPMQQAPVQQYPTYGTQYVAPATQDMGAQAQTEQAPANTEVSGVAEEELPI